MMGPSEGQTMYRLGKILVKLETEIFLKEINASKSFITKCCNSK